MWEKGRCDLLRRLRLTHDPLVNPSGRTAGSPLEPAAHVASIFSIRAWLEDIDSLGC